MNQPACLYPTMTSAGESGAALITGLIFLVVLTMIGITAAKMAGLEERMSGNLRDRSLAMQAAEMALRDAERDISKPGSRISGKTGFTPDCGGDPDTTEDDGLCWNGTGGYASPIWKEGHAQSVSMTAAPSVEYGDNTEATDIPLLPRQPRYLIEAIEKTPPGGNLTIYYRITVRAQGAYANTVVMLQEVFAP